MKTLLLALTLIVSVSVSKAAPDTKTANWNTFSKALVQAVQSDNAGVQSSALQHIARYGENLEVDAALFDIVRIYRNAEDENTRILALMALNKVGNEWTMDFLRRTVRFENNERILKHTIAVVNAH